MVLENKNFMYFLSLFYVFFVTSFILHLPKPFYPDFHVQKDMPNFPERLNRIDEVLAEIERSRKWLSDKTGINYRTVVRYCNNEAQPRLDMLKKIALVLDVKIADLIIDVGD